jgi:hypothetical protein
MRKVREVLDAKGHTNRTDSTVPQTISVLAGANLKREQ